MCARALKKEYGCQHYICVIRAIPYDSETDISSIVIEAIAFRHCNYSIGVRAILIGVDTISLAPIL